jgi:hypothetical protein
MRCHSTLRWSQLFDALAQSYVAGGGEEALFSLFVFLEPTRLLLVEVAVGGIGALIGAALFAHQRGSVRHGARIKELR